MSSSSSSRSQPINNFIFMVTFTCFIILLISIGNTSGLPQKQRTQLIEVPVTKTTTALESSSPSQWFSFSGLRGWLTDNKSESKNTAGSRTFGHIRRLQMALIPILFKFGVMSAMISVLVFLALKTVFLLKALLFLNAGALLAKILGSKLHHSYPVQTQPVFVTYDAGWNAHKGHGWTPYSNGWEKSHNGNDHNKEVHVHIHNDKNTDARTQDEYYVSSDWKRYGNNNNDPYRGYNNEMIQREAESNLPSFSNSYRNVDAGNYRRAKLIENF